MNHVLALSRPFEGLRRGAARLTLRAAALWHTYPRETMGVGLFGAVAAGVIASTALSGPSLTDGAHAAPPAPPPMLLRQIPRDQALKVNAETPLAVGPNPTAAP